MQSQGFDRSRDAFAFHAVASASLLESAVPEYVTNLLALFEGDEEVGAWLSGPWIAEELEHGRLLRAYVREVWPEFQWESAFSAYQGRIPKRTTDHLQSSRALEALARCVTETHAAMTYRCLASYSRDECLKRLLLRLGRDEVRHYRRFRSIFESYHRAAPESLWRRARTILARSDLARGRDLALAFSCLAPFWESPPPFVGLSYEAFRRRARGVIRAHLEVGPAARMLLRPLRDRATGVRFACWLLDKRFRIALGERGARGDRRGAGAAVRRVPIDP